MEYIDENGLSEIIYIPEDELYKHLNDPQEDEEFSFKKCTIIRKIVIR